MLTQTLLLSDSPVDKVKTLSGGDGAAAAAESRKRLMLSVAEKEKLLNWDTLVASEEAPPHSEQVAFRGRNKSLTLFPLLSLSLMRVAPRQRCKPRYGGERGWVIPYWVTALFPSL